VRRLTCRLAGQSAEAKLARSGHLTQQFAAELDCSALADGVYDLVLVADDGRRPVEHSRPVIVRSGKPTAFKASGPAKLRLRLAEAAGASGEVLLNGKPAVQIPAAKSASRELSLPLPADRLTRLAAIEIRIQGSQSAQVSQVSIEVAGQRHRDVRFPPNRRVLHGRKSEPIKDPAYYIDLTYGGPRGLIE